MTRRRLSERQIERIRTIQERRRRRLEERTTDILSELDEPAAPAVGWVVARHGANLAVEDEGGRVWHCLSRQNIGDPVCGDQVCWQSAGPGQGVVTALLARRTLLERPDQSGRARPLAANIDQLVVVLAPRPEPSTYLLDQYLVAAERMGVAALIAGAKMDLLSDAERRLFQPRFEHYARIGYPVIWFSLREDQSLAGLNDHLRGHTSILVGQSGVGKSSLVKALLPDREIQIGRLSQATGLGRHTTSATTRYRLADNSFLVDSPGVRSFRLGAIDAGDLARGFREFRPYLGRCRFGDCGHDQEPGCALKQAVAAGAIHPDRLATFLALARGAHPG
ncbi:ribosome small subunit-dependent GTPase A [Thioalkalicoccus limnaeus]|uniref:Small ribosomal subunit biogenesis GTPase RsgA n=1 Tax=Thioalkalicoccus limnaeus TaxID=120681 RepID=A0ABV4BDR9_9GAMM